MIIAAIMKITSLTQEYSPEAIPLKLKTYFSEHKKEIMDIGHQLAQVLLSQTGI
jgi:hypothetical protein